jgi:pullulanase/glycogen debranching enzyme
MRADLAARLAGSSDVFDHRHRRPWASINYIASHDGFTLHDLTSYAEKHNAANGRTIATATTATSAPTWARRGRPATPRSTRRATGSGARCWRPLLNSCRQGTPMLLGGDEVRPHPGRQQQRLLPGQLVLFNASENGVSFTLPERAGGQGWTVQVRTEDEGGDPEDGAVILGPRSLMVLA